MLPWRRPANISVAISAALLLQCAPATIAPAQTGIPSASPPPLAAGATMPSFETTTLNGKTFHSRSLLGHVTVIDMWATWCFTCKLDMRGIEKIHRDYAARGVKVVGISLDTDAVAQVGPEARQIGVTYPILVDAKKNIKIGRAYNADVLPCVYVIDKHGVVRWSYSGDYPTEDADIRRWIDKLLRSK
jgi:peroxiredoxin